MMAFALSQHESHLTSLDQRLCKPSQFKEVPRSTHIYTWLSLKPFWVRSSKNHYAIKEGTGNQRARMVRRCVKKMTDGQSTSHSSWWKARGSPSTRADSERQVITGKRASSLTAKGFESHLCCSWEKLGASSRGEDVIFSLNKHHIWSNLKYHKRLQPAMWVVGWLQNHHIPLLEESY